MVGATISAVATIAGAVAGAAADSVARQRLPERPPDPIVPSAGFRVNSRGPNRAHTENSIPSPERSQRARWSNSTARTFGSFMSTWKAASTLTERPRLTAGRASTVPSQRLTWGKPLRS